MTNALTNNGNGRNSVTDNILISLGNSCHGTGEVRLDGVCDLDRRSGEFSIHRSPKIKKIGVLGEGFSLKN